MRLTWLHFRVLLLLPVVAVASSGAAAALSPPPLTAPDTLELATWNMEWLLTPAAVHSLAPGCARDDARRRAARRQLPCDVARTLQRSASDFAALRRHADRLDADVIALQEVDGAAAARLVFRDHVFCFSDDTLPQNTGFAIRRGIPYRCEDDLRALSLGDTLRRGAVVTLFPNSPQALTLMSVHLKSGCARQPLAGGDRACAALARQLPVLAAWAGAQARAGHRFAILGDFNRDLLNESPAGGAGTVLGTLNHGVPAAAQLHSAATRSDFRNCVRGQRHNGFIDYLLLGTALADRSVPGSLQRPAYASDDAAHRILSDHCPVAVRIRP